jgi:hypothetical protein
MRTENKYIRNRRFRCKAWKRIRCLYNPYEHTNGSWYWTTEEQVKNNFEGIAKRARFIDSGSHKHWNHASASFRRELNKQRKAKERHALARINNGDIEYEVPTFKRDADWLYF